MTDLLKLPPAGDTPRKVADVVNQAVDAINYGQLQPRTVAELASEEKYLGRMFICTNETGGVVPVFCSATGTTGEWLRVTDRNVATT